MGAPASELIGCRCIVSPTLGANAAPSPSGLVASGQVQAEAAKQMWISQSAIASAAEARAAAEVNQGALGKVGKDIEATVGANFADPGPKSLSGIERKIAAGRAPNAVTDAVRGGFSVSSPEQADQVVRSLAKQFEVIDEDWAVTAAGYFDRKLLVRFPDGQIGEVQMWPPGMLEAKEVQGGHRLYEEMRVLPDGTPRKLELQREMRDLYGAVAARLPPSWKAVIGSGGT